MNVDCYDELFMTNIIIIYRYIIAISLGHVEVTLPYISDTGTKVPESSIFAQLLNFVAFLGKVVINCELRT